MRRHLYLALPLLVLLLVERTTFGFSSPPLLATPAATRKTRLSFPSTLPTATATATTKNKILLASPGSNNDDVDENKANDGLFSAIAKIPRPTLSQIVCLWLVGVSGNRLIETIPHLSSDGNGNDLTKNIAVNGLLFAGGLYTLVKGLAGNDYSKSEDLDTKSWAKQAGALALEGRIPTEYKDNDSVYQVATMAGGCFWGTELRFQRQVGVIATAVGYTQGRTAKPNYEQVCSGSTGHAEGIQLIYDPTVCSYERLVTILLDSIPDPTLLNRVGNDRGTQYRHGIYPHTDEQMIIAKQLCQSRQAQYEQPIVTEVKPAEIFWPAENYHQRYLEKRGQSAEKNCEERVRCYG